MVNNQSSPSSRFLAKVSRTYLRSSFTYRRLSSSSHGAGNWERVALSLSFIPPSRSNPGNSAANRALDNVGTSESAADQVLSHSLLVPVPCSCGDCLDLSQIGNDQVPSRNCSAAQPQPVRSAASQSPRADATSSSGVTPKRSSQRPGGTTESASVISHALSPTPRGGLSMAGRSRLHLSSRSSGSLTTSLPARPRRESPAATPRKPPAGGS